MKCHRAEQLILLKDSGELGSWGLRRLERHLARCERCRAYEKSLVTLTGAVRDWSAGSPADSTLAAIRNAVPPARDRREEIVLRPARRPAWQAALSYASLAAVLVAGGVWIGLPRHRAPVSVATVATTAETTVAKTEVAAPSADITTAWDDNLDEELDAINDVLASALDEKSSSGTTTTTSDETDADAIARELLTLQGYTI